MTRIIVAIDGPAGSGKSTVARKLAERLGFLYIDTGAMYRALTWKVLEDRLDAEDEQAVSGLARSIDLSFSNGAIYVNGVDYSKEVRLPEVSKVVSYVSALPSVREIFLTKQRLLAANNNAVMEGRDIGTTVFPDATFKFFLSASLPVRAQRRYLEIKEKDPEVSIKDIEKSIAQRDTIDTNRKVSPLIRAQDAIDVDTSDMTVEQVVGLLHGIVQQALSRKDCENGRKQ